MDGRESARTLTVCYGRPLSQALAEHPTPRALPRFKPFVFYSRISMAFTGG